MTFRGTLFNLFYAAALTACVMAAALHARAEVRPLVIAVGSFPSGKINPHQSASIVDSWLLGAMFDALTFLDRDGNLQPWLAAEWQRESDIDWTFTLRDNVRFSDGKPVTASDVVKNLTYLMSDAGAVERVAPFVSTIAAVEQIEDLSLRITTAIADPILPRRLSLVRIAALPDDAAFSRERLSQEAIGSGPYRLEDWAPAMVRLKAVPGAWRRAPTNELRGVAIADPPARRMAMVSEVVDIAVAAFTFDDLDNPDLPFNLEVDQIPAVVALAFNTSLDTPLKDPKVREAIALAVRVDEIVGILYEGRAGRATQPARKEFLGYNPSIEPTPYDPDRARQLLAEAGYPSGFDMDMSLTAGATVWDQLFLMMANDLAKVGIRMTIRMVPSPAWMEQVYVTGIKTEAYGGVMFAPTFDALDALRMYNCEWPSTPYCDPVAQALYDQARNTASLDERTALTQQLMARSAEMHQAVFLYESIGTVGYSKRITGFRTDFSFLRYGLMTVTDEPARTAGP